MDSLLVGERAPRRPRRALACGGLLLALGVGGAARWERPAAVADLRPRADALEYEVAARNLARGEGYSLVVEGKKYPPRYTFGFPAILVPFLAAGGDETGSGIRGVFVSALLAIAATWALGRASGGDASGVAAALLLALSPLHLRWSKAVMSDVPASATVAGLALWTLSALRRDARPIEWFALGALSGLGATIRFTNALLLAPTAVAIALRRRAPRTRSPRLAGLAGGALVGFAPFLAFNAARFGSPLATGYSFWVPGVYEGEGAFAWRHAADSPGEGGIEPNLAFYARTVAGLGEGRLQPWPLALLAIAGVVLALRAGGDARRAALLGVGFLAALLAFYVPYFHQSERFLLPAAPLLLALASLPFGRASTPAVRAGAFALALAGALAGAGEFRAAARSPSGPAPYAGHGEEVATLREIDRLVERSAALLVRTNAFFFERILRDEADRVWMPVGFCEHRKRVRDFGLRPYAEGGTEEGWIRDALYLPFDPARAEEAIRNLLGEGRPVYISTLLNFEVPFAADLKRLLDERFDLEPVAPTGRWELLLVRERR